jgi:hypothetical protein
MIPNSSSFIGLFEDRRGLDEGTLSFFKDMGASVIFERWDEVSKSVSDLDTFSIGLESFH